MVSGTWFLTSFHSYEVSIVKERILMGFSRGSSPIPKALKHLSLTGLPLFSQSIYIYVYHLPK